MPYCTGLRASSSCDSSGFCKISVSERREGGEDPIWTFPAGTDVQMTFKLHPAVIICLYISLGCQISARVEPRITEALEFRGAGRRSRGLQNQPADCKWTRPQKKTMLTRKHFKAESLYIKLVHLYINPSLVVAVPATLSNFEPRLHATRKLLSRQS